MKIVVLEGSPNRSGSTHLLAEAFSNGAKEAGHSVRLVDAAHANVQTCTGCVRCGYEGPCVQKDEMEEIRAAILEADMLVLANPIIDHIIPDRFSKHTVPKYSIAEIFSKKIPGLASETGYIGLFSLFYAMGRSSSSSVLSSSFGIMRRLPVTAMASWVLLEKPVSSRILEMCHLTVLTVMFNSCAISLYSSPSQTSRKTLSCASVSSLLVVTPSLTMGASPGHICLPCIVASITVISSSGLTSLCQKLSAPTSFARLIKLSSGMEVTIAEHRSCIPDEWSTATVEPTLI